MNLRVETLTEPHTRYIPDEFMSGDTVAAKA